MVRNYRKKREQTYNKDDLQAAVRAVRSGMSGNKAARIYRIPRMTVMDHFHGKRQSSKPGRKFALPLHEELKIASYLHTMERHGFGMSRQEVTQLIGEYVTKNNLLTSFKNGTPGKDWLLCFQRRHNLTVKKPQAVEYARKVAVDPFHVQEYYELLNKTIAELGLQDKPEAIWNLDETSFSKDPSKTKIVGIKGHAATRTISTSGKDNTTVLLGASAAGEKTPPLIIFKGKNIWDEWTSCEAYPGTSYAATKNGWMESDVFEAFFKKVFLPTVGDHRPVLLIYDGHATHVGLNIIQAARDENITILKLPAHTSHVLQPLDISVMKSFKDRWDVALVKWQRLNIGVTLPKKKFSQLIGEIWAEIPPNILISGFRKAGIYPFDPNAIEESKFDIIKLARWKEHTESKATEKDLEQYSATSISKNQPLKLVSIVLTFINHNMKTYTRNLTEDKKYITATKSSPMTPKQVTEGKKQLTFEEMLLEKIQHGDTSTKQKRCKVAPGAEVITHADVVQSKINKQIKNIKHENKTQKRRHEEKATKSSSPKVDKGGKVNNSKNRNLKEHNVTLLNEIKKNCSDAQAFIATDNDELPACLQDQTSGSSKIKILEEIILGKTAAIKEDSLQPGPSGVQTLKGKRRAINTFAASFMIGQMINGKENIAPSNQKRDDENKIKNKGIGKKSKVKDFELPSKEEREGKNKGIGKKSKVKEFELPSKEEREGKNKGIGKKSKVKEFELLSKEEREGENRFKNKGIGKNIKEEEFELTSKEDKQYENKIKKGEFTKKSKVKDMNITSKRTNQDRKYIKKCSSGSTSVSGTMSSHSDSDLAQIESDCESNNDFGSIVEPNITNNCNLSTNKTDVQVKNETDNENIVQDKINENDDMDTEETSKNPYSVDDYVIVRYYGNKWIYYVGIIEKKNAPEQNEYPTYSVKFLKTVKKPKIVFKTQRKIDRDDVPQLLIVKKVLLSNDSEQKNAYVLCNQEDEVYFC